MQKWLITVLDIISSKKVFDDDCMNEFGVFVGSSANTKHVLKPLSYM